MQTSVTVARTRVTTIYTLPAPDTFTRDSTRTRASTHSPPTVAPAPFVAAAQQRLPPWSAQWCPFRVTPKCHCAVIINYWRLYPIEGVDLAHDRPDSDRR